MVLSFSFTFTTLKSKSKKTLKKSKMRTLLFTGKIIVLTFLIILTACNSKHKNKDAATNENWIQLFNGKDLNDWQIKFAGYELGENFNNTFRVEDGLLRIRYDDWDDWGEQFGHIFYKDEFSHYKLRVEYRFVDEQVKGGPDWALRNNGLMLHGQSAESMELDQQFPTCIEVQLLGGNGTHIRSTMNLCTPGTNVVMNGELNEVHCINSESKTYHGDQWISAEVEVHGGEIIRHFVDGEEVMSYTKPQLDPRDATFEKLLPEDGNIFISKGTISLQAETSPTDFRKVELLVLEE